MDRPIAYDKLARDDRFVRMRVRDVAELKVAQGFPPFPDLSTRESIKERVHGIIPHGGDKPNIVPARASAHWYVRSSTVESLEALEQRVRACLQAGADAAGCEVTIEPKAPVYAEFVDNGPLIELYSANAERLGRRVHDGRQFKVVGSTDMGNVSQLVPSIHPMIRVAPPGVPIHTPAFSGFAGGPEGDAAVLYSMTLLGPAKTIEKHKKAFDEWIKNFK